MAARKKDKAVFIVKRHPYRHPGVDGLVPVGAEVDLSHLSVQDRARMVEKGVMEPTTEDALIVPGPEKAPEVEKLNKYGLPFGQKPKEKGG
jgi:hypothetical protein